MDHKKKKKKMDHRLNVKCKIIKPLEDSIRNNLDDLEYVDAFLRNNSMKEI